MSVFVPSQGAQDEDVQTIGNIAFFPDLELADFRDAMRVVEAIDDAQAAYELRRAMVAVNREVELWRHEKEASGHATLEDVPADTYDDDSELVLHYLAAIYHRAKAFLTEKERDFDTTAEGLTHTDGNVLNIEDHLRYVREHISALVGRPRATVELI